MTVRGEGMWGPGCETPEGSKVCKYNRPTKRKQKINSFHVLIGGPLGTHEDGGTYSITLYP